MKQIAAIIISIVFIFTACSRYAVENKAFNAAAKNQQQEQQKETSQKLTNPQNKKIPLTTWTVIKYSCKQSLKEVIAFSLIFNLFIFAIVKYRNKKSWYNSFISCLECSIPFTAICIASTISINVLRVKLRQ